MIRLPLRLLLTLFVIFLVSACGLTDNVMRDCVWVGDAKAWVDVNQDGNWNETEQPLENVAFFVDDTRNGYINVSDTAVSNSDGEAKYLVWLAGCPKVKFEAYAIAPANYLFTTESRLSADMSENNETFLFGFRYDPDAPTATPAPEVSMQCVDYRLYDDPFIGYTSTITDMAIGPEGEVWVATNKDQVTWFSADGEEQRNYTSLDGIPSNVVRTIEITPDGEIWLGTNEGIVRFDGAEWVPYTSTGKSAITEIGIDDIAVTPDGKFLLSRLWAWKGVIRFDLASGSSESSIFSEYISEADYGISAIHYSSNGSLWLFSENAIYQIPSYLETLDDPEWVVHKRNGIDGIAGIINISTEDVVVKSDEEIWIVGHMGFWSRIVNYNPVTGDWIAYDYETTNGGMPGNDVTSIALAEDGSLWVGLRDNGILHFLPGPNNEQNGTWLHYTMENGLLAESAYNVSLAPDGFIWFTNGGSSVQRCEEFRYRTLEPARNNGG